MASIRYNRDKEGGICSATIRVFRGRDADGKQLKPYCMTWQVPDGMKSENRIKKAASEAAGAFQSECEAGLVSADRKTFAEYSSHYMDLMERDAKHRTVVTYRPIIERVNLEIGHMKLNDVTGEHLNRLYLKLGKADGTAPAKMVCTPKLKRKFEASGTTRKALAAECGISPHTAAAAVSGEVVAAASAQAVAGALGIRLDDAFKPLANREPSASTVCMYHRVIHAVFAQAVKDGVIRFNPADAATPPKVGKREAEFFELDDVARIMEALEGEPLVWRCIVTMLIATGARRGEVMGLKWSNVDFDNNMIEIRGNLQYTSDRGIYSTSTKSDEARFVTVAPEAMLLMEKLKREQSIERVRMGYGIAKDDYCFTRHIREALTSAPKQPLPLKAINPDCVNRWLDRFSERHGLPHIHPHAFRHTQASILYSEGIDAVTISKRLGHKQVSTTQNIYSHLVAKADAKASEKVANIMFKHKTA